MNLVEAMCDRNLFEPFFRGPSWDNWRTALKATCGVKLDRSERAFFHTIAERDPPRKPVRELWVIAGRRAGKDSIASAIAAHRSAIPDYRKHVRPGETPLVQCLAVDKIQARIVKNYTRAYFDKVPLLSALRTKNEQKEGFVLSNGVELAVRASNFRVVRGRAIPCAIFDECAFWRDETSSAPDTETYAATVPGMATMPESLLVGISTPYRKSGLLYNKFKASFGKPDADALIIRAPSTALNPTLDQRIIDEAMERDPVAAASEWLASWRSDIDGYIDREAIEALVVPGRRELPRITGTSYVAFCDPSGGSSDSFTLAVAHRSKEGLAILDCVRERRPPFSPDNVVGEFAAVLKSYGLSTVSGDSYSAEWCRERFRVHGITYQPSDLNKSQIYLAFLAIANSGMAEILENSKLVTQIASLERRTSRSSREIVDHPVGLHDDLANAVAGALVLANKNSSSLYANLSSGAIARMSKPYVPKRPTLVTSM